MQKINMHHFGSDGACNLHSIQSLKILKEIKWVFAFKIYLRRSVYYSNLNIYFHPWKMETLEYKCTNTSKRDHFYNLELNRITLLFSQSREIVSENKNKTYDISKTKISPL